MTASYEFPGELIWSQESLLRCVEEIAQFALVVFTVLCTVT